MAAVPEREQDPVPCPAFDLTFSFYPPAISLKIADRQLAGYALAGLGLGCGVALAVFYRNRPELVENAIRAALEGPGVQVANIAPGSILVELHCNTQKSFLSFMEGLETEQVKERLNKEFSRIGYNEKLDVTITNKIEVYKKLDVIRKQVIFHKGALMVDEELNRLIDSIREYRVGNYERFHDALPGEMEGFRLNIVLFGMTGSGKSALINTIFECFDLPQPAVTQTTGKEGTKILEPCALSSHVALYDTRGFFDLDKMEEGELFRILYGIERPGDVLTRDQASAQKAAAAGVGAYRLEKPPIADQMHVVLWVIKANDIRFETGKYREMIKFVEHELRNAIIRIITVITFDDEVQNMSNPDEQRKMLKEAAREVTGSERNEVFMIANSIAGQDFDPMYKRKVLKMLEHALKCGERSIKMRQNQRESPKKAASYSRTASEPQGVVLKYPIQNTEPPDYQGPKSW